MAWTTVAEATKDAKDGEVFVDSKGRRWRVEHTEYGPPGSRRALHGYDDGRPAPGWIPPWVIEAVCIEGLRSTKFLARAKGPKRG